MPYFPGLHTPLSLALPFRLCRRILSEEDLSQVDDKSRYSPGIERLTARMLLIVLGTLMVAYATYSLRCV